MTPAELRVALNGEIDYWRRCIPGTDAARKAARSIVTALNTHAYLNDQVPSDVGLMVRREAMGLHPAAHSEEEALHYRMTAAYRGELPDLSDA